MRPCLCSARAPVVVSLMADRWMDVLTGSIRSPTSGVERIEQDCYQRSRNSNNSLLRTLFTEIVRSPGQASHGMPHIRKEHLDEFESWKTISSRFRGARSWEPAEAQGRSKVAVRLHRLWSGSSGSVVARRLAENPDVSVLLLETGGSDEVPSVTEASQRLDRL